ncbi:MAG: hypothetical protein K8W52_09840 [Deltaproteobacteria bacterium]|nr:hypothetical protein [Deltaproteobacteria bacterium]
MKQLACVVVVVAACGPPSSGTRTDAPSGPQVDAPAAIDAAPAGPPWHDFPAAPIIEPGAPADAPDLFTDPGTASGGPCLLEPQIGALFPNNWVRPRFNLVPPAGQNLFEIRVHADDEANDLVAYTTSPLWTMPTTVWAGLAAHVVDQPITLTVRGAVWNGTVLTLPPALGTTGPITIAPVAATGAIVYWTTSNGTSLKGFDVGEEVVHPVMTATQAGATECIGCHSSTPDGKFVGFSAYDLASGDRNRRADLRSTATATSPAFLTPAAVNLLARVDQNAPSFSAAHWTAGDHIALTMYRPRPSATTDIVWTNLEATAETQGVGWGIVARTGDTRSAASATFSNDGTRVAYVSAPNVDQSGTAHDEGDLYTVPYASGAGGTATPVAGASAAGTNEYYPDFSADDRLLAFNRATGGSYDNATAEVFVVPSTGGTATRLLANTPNACLGTASPGVTNSWPKWSPQATTVGTRTFYWLTFSSRRGPGGVPQLYVTGVVTDGATVTTYPAIYLWNQPAAENNHTPAWDDFDIVVN